MTDAGRDEQCIIAGRKKARVLPEPVSATPITSRAAIMIGQTQLWIGVGFANLEHALSASLLKPASAKVEHGRKSQEPSSQLSAMRCSLKKAAAEFSSIIRTVPIGPVLAVDAVLGPPFFLD
jgi:hypothetical protein